MRFLLLFMLLPTMLVAVTNKEDLPESYKRYLNLGKGEYDVQCYKTKRNSNFTSEKVWVRPEKPGETEIRCGFTDVYYLDSNNTIRTFYDHNSNNTMLPRIYGYEDSVILSQDGCRPTQESISIAWTTMTVIYVDCFFKTVQVDSTFSLGKWVMEHIPVDPGQPELSQKLYDYFKSDNYGGEADELPEGAEILVNCLHRLAPEAQWKKDCNGIAVGIWDHHCKITQPNTNFSMKTEVGEPRYGELMGQCGFINFFYLDANNEVKSDRMIPTIYSYADYRLIYPEGCKLQTNTYGDLTFIIVHCSFHSLYHFALDEWALDHPLDPTKMELSIKLYDYFKNNRSESQVKEHPEKLDLLRECFNTLAPKGDWVETCFNELLYHTTTTSTTTTTTTTTTEAPTTTTVKQTSTSEVRAPIQRVTIESAPVPSGPNDAGTNNQNADSAEQSSQDFPEESSESNLFVGIILILLLVVCLFGCISFAVCRKKNAVEARNPAPKRRPPLMETVVGGSKESGKKCSKNIATPSKEKTKSKESTAACTVTPSTETTTSQTPSDNLVLNNICI